MARPRDLLQGAFEQQTLPLKGFALTIPRYLRTPKPSAMQAPERAEEPRALAKLLHAFSMLSSVLSKKKLVLSATPAHKFS
jgi:hypothetical protein